MSTGNLYLGMDVHKESVVVAVLPEGGAEPTEVRRLANEPRELVTIRVPTEAQERVRDLVRCRETFQREILKSRHYVLKFLGRRGFVYREGRNWTQKHHQWLRGLVRKEALPSEDGLVLEEYLALLDYKLARRQELDRRIEELAFSDAYREAVERLRCFRGI